MPPLRPLPDLCFITLFKMMPPNDQMVASQMSPRCAVLVKAANRTVKTLVITGQNFENRDLNDFKDRINHFSLASKPAMQLLVDIFSGEPSFPDYPMTTRLSKWNCLDINSIGSIDTATTEQIVNVFSAVTNLKFFVYYYIGYCETLVSLLHHPNWQCQLTDLMVDWKYRHQSGELITAINGCTALQNLALQWDASVYLPDLTILAQLKVVVFKADHLIAFVRSLERYATDNAYLQVHLISRDTHSLLSLSQPLHSRIVRYDGDVFTPMAALHLCDQFRSLTSLSIDICKPTEIVQLFTALSPLQQLVHLGLWIDWNGDEKLPPARPLAQLNSVRALELDFISASHSQLEWLNLSWTLPHLKTIYTEDFACFDCAVHFISWHRLEDWSLLNLSSVLKCFSSSFFKLHCGVPMNRFIFCMDKELISAEKLLLLQSPTTSQS